MEQPCRLEGLKWWWWQMRVNWYSLRYQNRWCAIECAPEEARDAYDGGDTPWDYFVEGFCRE